MKTGTRFIIVSSGIGIGVSLITALLLFIPIYSDDFIKFRYNVFNILYYPVIVLMEYIVKEYHISREFFLPLCIPIFLIYAGIVGGFIGFVVYLIRCSKRK